MTEPTEQPAVQDAPMSEARTSTYNDNNNNEDDASAATEATTVYQPIPYEGDEKEYTIKFVFRPNQSENFQIARLHYDILFIISQVYPEVKIFNNRGAKLNRKTLESMKAYTSYLRHFDLHYSKGNPNKKRDAMYVVIHRF